MYATYTKSLITKSVDNLKPWLRREALNLKVKSVGDDIGFLETLLNKCWEIISQITGNVFNRCI